ncbi:hypothetical protein KOR42_37690 [Thalassoglobus neptunius]|uniref:Uncharacterized protein n=1 Tax=Thalassoglobus neptunius TaxID=1938619 RepID=A0A5C5WIW1_9PLAN|nr:hypothetical protein [Thalassoglobus neptunius]TWT49951.1 hypothetical protein KOR42_37690 [Thalassoglobus neptunius]
MLKPANRSDLKTHFVSTSMRVRGNDQQALHTFVLSLVAALTIFLSPCFTYAQNSDPNLITVSEVQWGFDGRVLLDHFIPVTFQVHNLGPNPWQGELKLQRTIRQREHVFGGTYVQPVTLQGEETRWVQMVVYVPNDVEDWSLSWGPDKNHSVDFPPVVEGERATLLVYDTDGVQQGSSVLKRMSEDRFPTTIAALDGLRGLILDSPPFWQGARIRALRDWLYSGGRIYILFGPDRTYPVFPKAMDFLNRQEDFFQIGQGTVQRIPLTADEFSLEEARTQLFNEELTDKKQQILKEKLERQQTPVLAQAMEVSQSVWTKNADIFRELIEFSKFQRKWWLIYPAVIAYLFLLFPTCFQIGTEQRAVRTFYIVFLSSALLFSLVFALLGKVGGGVRSRIRTVAVARTLGDGAFDVTGWSTLANVFAGEFDVEFAGTGGSLTTAQEVEAADVNMLTGTDCWASAKMPPDSRQTFHYRTRVTTDFGQPVLLTHSISGLRLLSISIDISEAISQDPLQAFVIYNGTIYELDVTSPTLTLATGKKPTDLETYLYRPYSFGFNTWNAWNLQSTGDEEEDEKLIGLLRYKVMNRLLVGSSFGLTESVDPIQLKLPDGTARLLILAELPEEMRAKTDHFPDQEGVVMYFYDFELDLGSRAQQ